MVEAVWHCSRCCPDGSDGCFSYFTNIIFANMKKVVNIGDNCVILVYNKEGCVVVWHG